MARNGIDGSILPERCVARSIGTVPLEGDFHIELH
jgi:hypothetical protein